MSKCFETNCESETEVQCENCGEFACREHRQESEGETLCNICAKGETSEEELF